MQHPHTPYAAHHVPHVVSQPVDDGVTAAHKLQVFGLRGFLCNQEHHKAGRHKGHGHNDEDGNFENYDVFTDMEDAPEDQNQE